MGGASEQGGAIQIVVPGPPVAKGRPRLSTRGGFARAYTPAPTRRYEDLIRLEAGRVMEGLTPLQGPLSVTVHAFVAMPKSLSKRAREAASTGQLRPITRPDCDNYAKLIDAFNGIVWADDNQVVDLTVAKFYSEMPRLSIRVEAA